MAAAILIPAASIEKVGLIGLSAADEVPARRRALTEGSSAQEKNQSGSARTGLRGANQKSAQHADLVSDAALTKSAEDVDWPQFRGTGGQGISSCEGLPLRWSSKKNIAWKVPIPGFGLSSPVIVGDRIWLTTAVDADKTLHVLCLDAASGELLFDTEAFRKESFWGIHWKNSHATPTPVIVGDRCYVHFGSHGTIALNLDGEVLWRTEIPYYHHHGPGSSPVVVDETLIIPCDGYAQSFYDDRKMSGVTSPQFVVGLDTATGAIRWKAAREGAHSYATPLVIEVGGQKQVVAPGGNRVVAYDPVSGEELWFVRYEGYSLVPRPVFGHGLVFICTGYDNPVLMAIRPEGEGNITSTRVVWKSTTAVPLNPSPILVGDDLYTISDIGVISSYQAATGKLNWRRRVGGNHSASPVFAAGRLYFLNETGETTVVAADAKYQVLARNRLRGKTLSSLSVSGKAIFLRTDKHLYRIEELQPETATGSQEMADEEDEPESELEEPEEDEGIKIPSSGEKNRP